jgi:hypothetical protein
MIIDGLVVPDILAKQYTPIKVYPLDFLNTSYAKGHRRLTVFHHKGVKCVVPGCDCEGTYVIETLDPGGGRHIDVYTRKFELMTVDHIIPKSRGGGEELSNKQPMCNRHNASKGNKMMHIPSELLGSSSTIEEDGKVRQFLENSRQDVNRQQQSNTTGQLSSTERYESS